MNLEKKNLFLIFIIFKRSLKRASIVISQKIIIHFSLFSFWFILIFRDAINSNSREKNTIRNEKKDKI